MRTAGLLLVSALALVAGSPRPAVVEQNPSVAALLRTVNFETNLVFCVGSILNNRSILTAARCVDSDPASRWRIRLGSSAWNSGGVIYNVAEIILYDDWDEWANHGDLAILRSSTAIAYGPTVQPGSFAGADYVVQSPSLRIIGWGYLSWPFWMPTIFEDMHEVQMKGLDIEVCRPWYSAQGFFTRDTTQICTGFSSLEGVSDWDVCYGEPGAPVFHGNVIYGVRSYGLNCHLGETPSISTRVGPFIDWISSNA